MKRRSLWLVLVAALALGVGCSPPPDQEDTGPTVIDDDTSEGPDDAWDVSPDDPDGTDMPDGEETDTEEDTSDDDPDTGTSDTEGDTSGSGGDADVGPDADSGEVDTGPDCSVDSDADGLNDCEEANLCSDPHDGDTDGDSLGDFEELQNQTDPCSKDTDNDGATDKEELEFNLDPNRVDTYGDGTKDGDRWILRACDNPAAEKVDFYKNATGNWTLALTPAFNNYTELTLTNSQAPEAAAVYDDPANEVAGYLLSKDAKAGQTGPVDALRNEVLGKLGSVGSVVQDSTGGAFDTHDGKTAAIGRYLVQLNQSKSTRKVREDLLFALSPFGKSDVQGLPSTAGKQHSSFQVFVSVIFRTNSMGTDQSLISVAVTPDTRFKNNNRVKFRMDDLTNTTNISEQVDAHLVKCTTFQPGRGTPKSEFYWVLDQSGSMNDDNQKVANFATQFEKEVKNTSLDYRLGVTNMDKNNDGHLRVPPAWHTNGSTFKSEIQQAVINCSFGGSWACSGGAEHGLEAAKRGLSYMTGQTAQSPTPAERIRSNTQVITIFMSDEEANSIKSNQQTTQHYIQFFKGRTIAFAIVAEGYSAGCPSENGKAYKDVALATGGKFASLCAKDLTQTIRDIIFAATGLASNYVLPQTPISSSLRVYLNGTWVPRSRSDGFEYFAENNSIAFFGDFRPSPTQMGATDFIAVSYETFKDRCKQNSSGSNNCGGGMGGSN